MTFWKKDKYIASLSSFANLIPVKGKKTGKRGGKNLSFIIARYETIGMESNKLGQCIWQIVKGVE